MMALESILTYMSLVKSTMIGVMYAAVTLVAIAEVLVSMQDTLWYLLCAHLIISLLMLIFMIE